MPVLRFVEPSLPFRQSAVRRKLASCHEIKHDGFRIGRRGPVGIRLVTRRAMTGRNASAGSLGDEIFQVAVLPDR
jgi:hypothetical protein